MSALIPSAHYPDDFFFNYFLLVFIRMVEVLQNILCKSKSFSLTLRNKSEVFRNEKVSKSSIFF